MFKQNQQSKIFLGVTSHKFVIIPACALLGVLALVSTFFISADLASNSYALDGTNLNSEVTAEIDGTHYVTLSASDVTFSITPNNGTASDKKQVDVELSTNVSGGASLYLSTSSNKNALYLNGDTNSTSKNIASASSTTTYDNMTNNTWAYSTDDINYQGVPTLDSPVLLSDIDGTSTGTNTNGVVSATIPIYYAAKVDTSIPSGSYANSVTYSAVVDGGIVTSAELTSITVDGNTVEQLQLDKINTILVTTNLKTNAYGIPRVYYTTTDPAGYSECSNVLVSSNTDGYMTIQCETTPTTVATGLTLHIVPKDTPSSTNPSDMTGDPFCSDGTYQPNTSECEAGEWKWGSFTVGLPDVAPPPIPLMEQTYMQDMTPGGCAISNEGDTKRLIDKRDGKYYWVAKLADGNCWMTQNLDLDLVAGKKLIPADSDTSSSWDPGVTTLDTAQTSVHSNTVVQSWDLGNVVWMTPDSSSGCGGSSGDYNFATADCDSYWQDVSSWTPMTEYRTDGISVENNTYDAHYLVGNYYSWQAVTAGTGVGITTRNDKAPDSICPKGFELPTSGISYNSTSGSFYNLLSKYDLASNPTSGNNNIVKAPLFFVRSGSVDPTFHYLVSAGSYGSYWSSVVRSSNFSYYLSLTSNDVEPTPLNGISSWMNGRSVRCVAPSA